jgi:DNA-binding NarL/FixJ family response regulator
MIPASLDETAARRCYEGSSYCLGSWESLPASRQAAYRRQAAHICADPDDRRSEVAVAMSAGRRLLQPPRTFTVDELTNRQREVLALLAAGWETKEVARRLGITAWTVYSHVDAVKIRLRVTTRAAAIERWQAWATLALEVEAA